MIDDADKGADLVGQLLHSNIGSKASEPTPTRPHFLHAGKPPGAEKTHLSRRRLVYRAIKNDFDVTSGRPRYSSS